LYSDDSLLISFVYNVLIYIIILWKSAFIKPPDLSWTAMIENKLKKYYS